MASGSGNTGNNYRRERQGGFGNNEEIAQALTEQFAGELDVDIVESVLIACNYDFELSSRNLADMLGISLPPKMPTTNPPASSTSTMQNTNVQTDIHKDLNLPLVEFTEKGYRAVIIMRGLPGSGKSTLAKHLLGEIVGPCNPRDFIFSSDDFFMQNGEYRFNSYQLQDAHNWNQNRAYAAMQRGISPIMIDNTNSQTWEMKPYIVWAVQNGYQIYVKEPSTSWAFKVSELARRNKHKVPKESIINMLDRYDRNVSVPRLLQEFELYYSNLKPPVMRNFPPVRNKSFESTPNRKEEVNKKDATTSTKNDEAIGKQLGVRGNFINNGQLPPKYPREGFYDKGTNTDEEGNQPGLELNDDEVKNKAVDSIQSMFETIPREYLEDILFKCRGDVEWCINLLLEDPKQVLEDYQPVKKKQVDVVIPLMEEENLVEELQDEACAITYSRIEHQYGHDEQKAGTSHSLEDGFVMLDDFDDDGAENDDDQDGSISEDSEPLSAHDDDMVDLNLGPVLVEQLNLLFGDPEFQLPGFYSPIVEVPRKLAKQLHALYYESVLKQMEVQQVMLQQMLQEDEEMQMKLQMEEIRKLEEPSLKQIMKDQAEEQRNQKIAESQWRNVTPQHMAYKLTIQKLSACFPDVAESSLEEIYTAHESNFEETVAALQDSGAEYVENVKQTLSAGTLDEMQAAHDSSKAAEVRDKKGFENRELTSQQLRQEAAEHHKNRVDMRNKARLYSGKGMTEVAMFYSDLASQQTRMWEKYNSLAAVQIVNEGFYRSDKADTIDLHFLHVKEAMIALDIYIDEVIDRLKSGRKSYKDIFVITGRGKNSPNGIPRIRPGVEKRLKKRGLKFSRVNDGLLKVKVSKTSLVTAQMQE